METASIDAYDDPGIGNKSVWLFEESDVFVSVEERRLRRRIRLFCYLSFWDVEC